MEKIVGWMKVHSEMGCGFTIRDTNSNSFSVKEIGKGGVTLLREDGNVVFGVVGSGWHWKDCPQEWIDQGYGVEYSFKAQGGKHRRDVVTAVTGKGNYDVCTTPKVDLHYYCRHSPIPEHVEQLIALAKRHIAAMNAYELAEKDYTAEFVVHIVTDDGEVLSVSEKLSRAVNEAVSPKLLLADPSLLLCGGFSVNEIALLSSTAGLIGHSIRYYKPRRGADQQPHYPVPRQSKRRIFK